MKLNFIKHFFAKTVAKQLRKPDGILARKIGNGMNKTNSLLYDFTLDAMQLKKDESILEIGFGNGKFFPKLFSTADNLKISGLDFSPEMVKEATANNGETLKTGALTLRLGSSNKIPFPDNSFDKVFCINVVYFWEQPAEHLKEIYRVLKPGGKFYTGFRPETNMLQMPFTQYGFTLYSEDKWKRMLEKNHFTVDGFTKTTGSQTKFGGKNIIMEAVCMVSRK